MKAGFSETIITPKDGRCILAGYGEELYSHGVHDDLYASAVYLEDEHTKVILISFDLIGLDEELIARLKNKIQEEIDINQESIFLTCTHTHAGPVISQEDAPQADYIPEYIKFLEERVKKVSRQAATNARECELRVNRSYIDENVNRRFFLSNDIYLNISKHRDLIPIAYEYADKELGVLYFCPKDVRGAKWPHPYGVIVNYTMHPLTAGNTSLLISADVPGVVRNTIKESMECLTCYITGAAGDNHPKKPGGGFAETRRVGEVIATELIKRRWDSLLIEEPIKLKCTTRSVRLKYRSIEELKSIPGLEEFSPDRAHALSRLSDNAGKPVDVSYSLLAIGPILFIGVPGELVSELGRILKWCSPFKRTYIMYQATGNLGYIAHPNAYRWGGYEAINGLLSPSSVRPLINAILDSAEELYMQ